jgi:hypothetical protein
MGLGGKGDAMLELTSGAVRGVLVTEESGHQPSDNVLHSVSIAMTEAAREMLGLCVCQLVRFRQNWPKPRQQAAQPTRAPAAILGPRQGFRFRAEGERLRHVEVSSARSRSGKKGFTVLTAV